MSMASDAWQATHPKPSKPGGGSAPKGGEMSKARTAGLKKGLYGGKPPQMTLDKVKAPDTMLMKPSMTSLKDFAAKGNAALNRAMSKRMPPLRSTSAPLSTGPSDSVM
jgi:hypothetical protein